ncbi:FAD-dependent oxidoreductase [Cellulomonas humilata]|uniref:FAD-dependent oxidoreductase n=1 Tax=Cellulomonas humilata TaxID=144055 RepID=A0A7Y5ZZU7_9CELL|nr:FAD-dependent oxidoreductase [Cellulomonas humilata]NUU16563.1 FAD-dependent oxidoreductase [Cellulomonas humilata]
MHLVVVGGSDAGISAALRARELDESTEVTVVVADAYPNYSICGIPYYVSGEVTHWRNLAHRTREDLEATGMRLRLETLATTIDVPGRRLRVRDRDGEAWIGYDALVVGTGAVPVRPPIDGLDELGPRDGVHLLHTMGDTFDLMATLDRAAPRRALIVGAGYVGLEMAEGLTARGIHVTQVERLPEVLPTVDPELGALVRAELLRHGVDVHTGTSVTRIARRDGGLRVDAQATDGDPIAWDVDLVLVVTGVRPDTELLVAAGATTGPAGAVDVGSDMRTSLDHVWAAGDCVITHHRLLGRSYLPLGTTAHKQGRVAGENALGGNARYAGSVGTQVVKVFDLVAARTGLRDLDATAAYPAATTHSSPDDHKRYYPGAQPISIRITGDTSTGRLLGAQLVGGLTTQTAKRVDTLATALFHEMTVEAVSELDLSYTPPLGSPWDAVQLATQDWVRHHRSTLTTGAPA